MNIFLSTAQTDSLATNDVRHGLSGAYVLSLARDQITDRPAVTYEEADDVFEFHNSASRVGQSFVM